jgi:excisionase family DNA binding protein
MDTVPAGKQEASFKPRRLITAAEVAERLALTESGVYEMARQNRIGGIVRVGRRVRFDPDKLEAWIEAGGQALPGGWRQEAA